MLLTPIALVLLCFFLSPPTNAAWDGVHRFETCKFSMSLRDSPFCNTTLDLADRVAHLVSLLTIEEKFSLLDTSSWEAGVPRIQLSPFKWGQEGLHGLASCNFTTWKVTSFPQVINMGRTFDMPLIHAAGNAISDEARALSNILAIDLSFWAPNLNIFRDPRWGRGQETPGEDPFLTSTYAHEFISGLQFGSTTTPSPTFLKAISGTKHYTAYDLEHWGGRTRHDYNAIVTPLDMQETYQPPFESAVRNAHVKQVMCSYNSINGVPSCCDGDTLQTQLRDTYGFDGHVVSDCGAVKDIMDAHVFSDTPEEAVRDAMVAGTDLDCGPYYSDWGMMAYATGVLNQSTVDLAVSRLFVNRMRLGEFDPWEDQPFRKIGTDVIASKDHLDLGLKLTQESLVMLKNQNGVLPLDPNSISVLAVLGPNAKATTMLQGDYSGPPPFIISPYDGIAAAMTKTSQVLYAEGCTVKGESKKGFDEAIAIAKQADAVVLVMGYDHWCERESQDRYKLTLTGVQEQFIQEVAAAVGDSKPLILISINGGPIDFSWERDSSAIDAIVLAGYPGMFAGQAMADLLFGNISPSGRTVMTMYPKEYVDQVSMFDMAMRPSAESPGRSYKFYTGTPVFPFGSGLSYTTFKYVWYDPKKPSRDDFNGLLSRSVLQKSLETSWEVSNAPVQYLSVNVTNTGSKWTSDDVVLAFITMNTNRKHPLLGNGASPPLKQLWAFERLLSVVPGETRTVKFGLSPRALSSVTAKGNRVIVPGEYIVMIGQCPDQLRTKKGVKTTSTNCIMKSIWIE